MERSDATHVAVGGTLLGLGGAGVFTLLIYAAGPKVSAWHQAWFLVALSFALLLAGLGFYILLAIYTPLPLPQTRSEREAEPRLVVEDVRLLISTGREAQFEIGFANAGRGDIPSGVLNIVVPDFVTWLAKTNRRGSLPKITERHEQTASTSESIYTDEAGLAHASNYWNGREAFPGRSSRVMYFIAGTQGNDALRDFPIRVRVTAAELREPVQADFHLHLPTPEPVDEGTAIEPLS